MSNCQWLATNKTSNGRGCQLGPLYFVDSDGTCAS
jgi:hypothetical protein